MDSPIIIILATFNGAKFLPVQLDSLIAQTEIHWTLLIRDDGSTDHTLRIIRDYAKTDSRFKLLANDDVVTGTALSNFSFLLDAAYKKGARYIFCCDQDDAWQPDKLKFVLSRLKQVEKEGNAPCLIHHDLMVVNESLELIADSFVDLMQLQPSDQHEPQRLFSRNEVTGCAMACNRALLEIALPISEEAVMHDWWLALCAGCFGRLEYMPEKLVKYRQHDKNTIGAKSFWHGLNPFTNWLAGWRRGDQEFISVVKQAEAFRDAMADRLEKDSNTSTTLKMFSELVTATRWQRFKTIHQIGLWRGHWLLNIVLILRLLLLPRAPGE